MHLGIAFIEINVAGLDHELPPDGMASRA